MASIDFNNQGSTATASNSNSDSKYAADNEYNYSNHRTAATATATAVSTATGNTNNTNSTSTSTSSNSNIDRFLQPLIPAPPLAISEYLTIVKRSQPNDGDCVFSAIIYCIQNYNRYNNSNNSNNNTIDNLLHPELLRSKCVEIVSRYPTDYPIELLGYNSIGDYSTYIVNPFNWAGANEFTLLSRLFNIEIVVLSINQPKYIVYNNNNNNNNNSPINNRLYLYYSNSSHYDVLVVLNTSTNTEYTIVQSMDKSIEKLMFNWIELYSKQQEYSNNSSSSSSSSIVAPQLICSECYTILMNNTEAEQHCRETEHIEFEAYSDTLAKSINSSNTMNNTSSSSNSDQKLPQY